MNGSSPFRVRDATPADGPAIGRVHVAAWRGAYAGLMPAPFLAGLDEQAQGERWARGIAADPRALVVELDGAVLGFARYGDSRDEDAARGVGELIAINLQPDAWRRGAGSVLMVEALARLRAAGFREATLWVVHGNARARAFYEARGWRTDGAERRDDRFRTGAMVHEVRYRKVL